MNLHSCCVYQSPLMPCFSIPSTLFYSGVAMATDPGQMEPNSTSPQLHWIFMLSASTVLLLPLSHSCRKLYSHSGTLANPQEWESYPMKPPLTSEEWTQVDKSFPVSQAAPVVHCSNQFNSRPSEWHCFLPCRTLLSSLRGINTFETRIKHNGKKKKSDIRHNPGSSFSEQKEKDFLPFFLWVFTNGSSPWLHKTEWHIVSPFYLPIPCPPPLILKIPPSPQCLLLKKGSQWKIRF